MLSLFTPMDKNIFFIAIIIASFVQPFSDFSYTICKIASLEKKDCLDESKIATFVFTLTYFFYRCVQGVRSHMQTGDRCYSRPLIGLTSALFNINTVISSYLYTIYLTNDLLIYWIVSTALSTLAGIQADFRADWGLFGIDKEDMILRKYIYFPRSSYFVMGAINIVLKIGWILTISNNTANNIGVNPVYFLMVLSYIEIARKGMWMFIRIE
jgi:hypothetical protein